MSFVLDGVDVNDFAESWLSMLSGPEASMKGLRDHVGHSYTLGAAFMMANIGPQIMRPDATEVEFILYACLAAFQNESFPDRPDQWQSPRTHLELAFQFAQRRGRTEIARNLLTRLVEDSKTDSLKTRVGEMRRIDPGELAAHDRDMATIFDRDIRAAAILDPSVSLDHLLLE